MNSEPDYVELLTAIVTPIVEHDEAVSIEEVRDQDAVQLQLKVSPSDAGRVIGRGGATIGSIRTVVDFAGRRNNDRVTVHLMDD